MKGKSILDKLIIHDFMNILIVGDIFSKLGRESFEANLRLLKEQRKIHFIVSMVKMHPMDVD
jgi:hypothetical protein